MIYATEYQSPFGGLTLFATDVGLTGITFNDPSHQKDVLVTKEFVLNPQAYPDGAIVPDETRFKDIFSELDSYFKGSLRTFTVPIDYANNGTDFQRSVWNALRDIPYGSVVTYGDLAATIGNAKAARAVGLANNRNPLAIIVPCHRVIGANGRLVGYAGGLPFKRSLLDLEGVSLGEDVGESSRDAILNAGTIAFSNNGYNGTTIDDVAKLAGVNKRMIYQHFGSKRGLYEEVVAAAEASVDENGLDAKQADPNVALRLKLFQLLESGSTTDPVLAADIEANLERVARMQADGRMDARYDAQLVARFMTIADQWRIASEKPRTRVDPVVSPIKRPS